MIAEILTIGDELLCGSRIDTNAAYIARRLDLLGLDVRYKSTAGDNLDLLEEAINLALRRADVIIATGGLGPTDDDITKKVICKVFKRNLIFHEDVLAEIEKRFAARGAKMPSINQNQALLPQGAGFLPNRIGSALGIIIDEQGKFFCALPGVPNEAEIMIDEELAPLLAQRAGNRVIIRRLLRTTGIIESALAEIIRTLPKIPDGVSLAYLPSYRGVDLALKGTGTVAKEVQAAVDTAAGNLRQGIARYIYTEDDRELEEIVGELLVQQGKSLATAESCTGGMLGGRITRISGSSRYYRGGVVAYADEVKRERLGVPETIIAQHGAVSAETAEAMASGVREAIGADLGVAITGVAGPTGGTDDKPVGTVFIALATPAGRTSEKFSPGPHREANRERAVTIALDMGRKALLGLS